MRQSIFLDQASQIRKGNGQDVHSLEVKTNGVIIEDDLERNPRPAMAKAEIALLSRSRLHLSGSPQDLARQHGRTKSIVNIDHTNTGGTGIEHGQQRG